MPGIQHVLVALHQPSTTRARSKLARWQGVTESIGRLALEGGTSESLSCRFYPLID